MSCKLRKDAWPHSMFTRAFEICLCKSAYFAWSKHVCIDQNISLFTFKRLNVLQTIEQFWSLDFMPKADAMMNMFSDSGEEWKKRLTEIEREMKKVIWL